MSLSLFLSSTRHLRRPGVRMRVRAREDDRWDRWSVEIGRSQPPQQQQQSRSFLSARRGVVLPRFRLCSASRWAQLVVMPEKPRSIGGFLASQDGAEGVVLESVGASQSTPSAAAAASEPQSTLQLCPLVYAPLARWLVPFPLDGWPLACLHCMSRGFLWRETPRSSGVSSDVG